MNELVSSHEPASNTVLNVEDKTEHELIELSKEYARLEAPAKEGEEEMALIAGLIT